MNTALFYIIGAAFTLIAGTFLHFVYGRPATNRCVAIFGAVNESVWEHLKLLFWPTVVWFITGYFLFGKTINGYPFVSALAIWVGMLAVVVIFYTYTGILGNHFLAADILTFAIGVALTYLLSYYFLFRNPSVFDFKGSALVGILLLAVTAFAFILFTFRPPRIALFHDPATNRYGIASALNGALSPGK